MIDERTAYFIDYENEANGRIFYHLDDFQDGDKLFFFYSKQHSNLSVPFEQLDTLRKRRLDIETVPVYTDDQCLMKNALDFQLSSYVGFVHANRQFDKLVIVAKDTGYNPVVEFWTERGANIEKRTYAHKPIRNGEGKAALIQNDEAIQRILESYTPAMQEVVEKALIETQNEKDFAAAVYPMIKQTKAKNIYQQNFKRHLKRLHLI